MRLYWGRVGVDFFYHCFSNFFRFFLLVNSKMFLKHLHEKICYLICQLTLQVSYELCNLRQGTREIYKKKVILNIFNVFKLPLKVLRTHFNQQL